MKKPAIVLSLILILSLFLAATSCEDDAVRNRIEWGTDLVSLEADDFWILVNGQTFLGTDDVLLDSRSSHVGRHCTLRVTWSEHGVPMMLLIEFHSRSGTWTMENLWTYDASKEGELIRYDCPCGFTAAVGRARSGDLTLECAHGGYKCCGAKIHFDNMTVKPFLEANLQER